MDGFYGKIRFGCAFYRYLIPSGFDFDRQSMVSGRYQLTTNREYNESVIFLYELYSIVIMNLNSFTNWYLFRHLKKISFALCSLVYELSLKIVGGIVKVAV